MKNVIIALFVAFTTAPSAMAQHINRDYAMHVNTTDGKAIEYRFDMEPVVSFSDGQMVVETNGDAPVKFILDHVVKITFSGETTGIGHAVDKRPSLSVSVSTDELIINGMKAFDKVTVYGIDGSLLTSTNADANGHAVMNISHFGKGVFVVHMTTNAFKFIK